jgi:hypothetical protein
MGGSFGEDDDDDDDDDGDGLSSEVASIFHFTVSYDRAVCD